MNIPHVVTTFGWQQGHGTRLRGRYVTVRQDFRAFYTLRYYWPPSAWTTRAAVAFYANLTES